MPVSRGRLFRLQLERSLAARLDALATVRELPSGWWQARIGGRMRGETRRFPSKQQALQAVNDHYNEALERRLSAERQKARQRGREEADDRTPADDDDDSQRSAVP